MVLLFSAAKRFGAPPSRPLRSFPFRKSRSLFLNRILILSLLPAILFSATCTFTSSSATCRGTEGGDGAVRPCRAAAPQPAPARTKRPQAALRSSPRHLSRRAAPAAEADALLQLLQPPLQPPQLRCTRRHLRVGRKRPRLTSGAPGGCHGGALLRTAVAMDTGGEAASGGAGLSRRTRRGRWRFALQREACGPPAAWEGSRWPLHSCVVLQERGAGMY